MNSAADLWFDLTKNVLMVIAGGLSVGLGVNMY